MSVIDRNDLAYWFPLVATAGLRVPHTIIVGCEHDLTCVLDGETPDGWDGLIADLQAAGDRLGWPCFLRTGHGSGKHDWANTCHVPSADVLPQHVAALVEWSHTVDLMGLPTGTWAVRELLDTTPLFRCEGYGGFPVTREFRVFVRDGDVEHIQSYWPPDAIEQGRPDTPGWRWMLHEAADLAASEREHLEDMARLACRAVGGGHWSVDLLQDAHGLWFLTDMADGDRSFRWEPRPREGGELS